MAGIGLTLRKLVADQTYFHGAVAYFSSGMISAGPWLISVISLLLLQSAINFFPNAEDRQLLFATITYAFIGSLVVTGPIQFVLTRVIADHIFLDEADAISASFTRILFQALVILILVLIPFLIWSPFELFYRWLAASLFLTVSLLWLGLTAVSAAQDYLGFVLAFVIGYAVSVCAALGLGRFFGLSGALEGFTFGQATCLGLLTRRIYIEFPASKSSEASRFVDMWREYWSLALIGLFYYLGLWAEKIFYWFSPAATILHGFFRIFPPYDSSMLAAYLLTIPASAIILMNLETEFYDHYHEYYGYVLGKGKSALRGTLKQIDRSRSAMMRTAQLGFLTLIKVQGMIAMSALLFAPDLARIVGLSAHDLITFRIAILSASGQVFVLYDVLLLLYLDARYETLWLVFFFAVANITLTYFTAEFLPGVYGLGYLSSTLIAALLGACLLNSRLSRLTYITFMLQPFESNKKPHRKVTT